jgi:hypothetical protein
MNGFRTPGRLAAGVLAGLVFVAAFLIEGATRPAYEPLRHPVSSLAFGDLGWTQRANFIVTGLLTVAFASGLRDALRPMGGSRWAVILVAAIGVGFIGAGIFMPDPLNGYPPGTPKLPVARSTSGVLHDLFSTGFFGGLPAACFVLARRFVACGDKAWAAYSIGTGLAFVIAFVLTSAGFRQVDGLADIAGLLQRATVVIGLTWMGLLSLHLLRNRTDVRMHVRRGRTDLAA